MFWNLWGWKGIGGGAATCVKDGVSRREGTAYVIIISMMNIDKV